MAILVLFEQFSRKVGHIFGPWPLTFDYFTNDAFCSHSFECASLRRLRHIVTKRFEIMEKFYSSKTLLKMAGGGNACAAYSTPPWIRPWLYNNKRWPQILRETL